MESIPVAMTRENLENIPQHSLPVGYYFRTFKPGEELVWANVQVDAGAFENIDEALKRFEKDFAGHIDAFEKRCIFLAEESTHRVIGTTTAWYHPDREGDDRGRIHWVAIIPEFQGRKLAKPMLSEAMRLLSISHSQVHLWSRTSAQKAINMYLDYAFIPANVSERFDEAWAGLADILDHPALDQFRKKL